MKRAKILTAIALLCAVTALNRPARAQGTLAPPGPPAAGMKTLDQIEPRTPITNLPYTVTVPGAYYLTRNLSGTNGIVILADNVDIDLGGFTLSGEAGAISGSGISLDFMGGILVSIKVHNGALANWPEAAVALYSANNSQVSDLLCTSNGMGGISIGLNSLIRNCTVLYSGMDNGIAAGNGSVVRDCAAAYNENSGIQVGQGCQVVNCSVYGNGRGIYGGDGSSAIECNALQNGSQGIYLAECALVESCTARGNQGSGIEVGTGSSVLNCSVRENEDNGIKTGNGCTVRECTVSGNFGDGIRVYNDCTVSENVCMDNGESDASRGGIHVLSYAHRTRITNNRVSGSFNGIRITDTDNIVAGNISLNNTVNYDIVTGNQLDLLLSEVPEVISWPAVVRFAGTLECTENGIDGITVESDNVAIDLGGHSLIGPGPDSGHGIMADDTYRNVTVRNGYVVNWRGPNKKGVLLTAEDAHVENVHATSNYYGIFVGDNASVRDCVSAHSKSYGFYGGKLYVECRAHHNGESGFQASSAAIAECESAFNMVHGFSADGGSTLRGCTASWNGSNGFYVAESVVDACTAYRNNGDGIGASASTVRECSSTCNKGDGIDASGYCLIEHNKCYSNGDDPFGGDALGAGIRSAGHNRIDENTVTANDWGVLIVSGDPIVIRNTGSQNPPGTSVSNFVGHEFLGAHGPIIDAGFGGGDLSTLPGADHPWANFEF